MLERKGYSMPIRSEIEIRGRRFRQVSPEHEEVAAYRSQFGSDSGYASSDYYDDSSGERKRVYYERVRVNERGEEYNSTVDGW